MKNKFKPPALSTSFSESGKNAKKRFDNILNTKIKKKGTIAFSCFLCLIVLCGALAACNNSIGIIGGADGPTAIFVSENDNIKQLYNARIKYVGNASGVGKLVELLNEPSGFGTSSSGLMELQTTFEPYGLTLNYEITDPQLAYDSNYTLIDGEFKKQAAILLCLIENLGSVTYSIKDNIKYPEAEYSVSISREDVDLHLGGSVSEYSQSLSSITELYNMLLSSPSDIETAVSAAILEHNIERYIDGECAAEGHIILGTDQASEDANSDTYVYVLTTYGNYGFENDTFVKMSGTGIIPVKITLSADYKLKNYEESLDGSMWNSSIKEIFPQKYHNRIFSSNNQERTDYQSCTDQEHSYARQYLYAIGRNAEIADNIERPLANMKAEFSNSFLDMFGEYPYWIGTHERLENGIRYVYEKAWHPESKDSQDGTVTYTKYEYDTKKIIEEYVIKLKGNSIEYLKGTPRPENYSKSIGY